VVIVPENEEKKSIRYDNKGHYYKNKRKKSTKYEELGVIFDR
jgi:hypothetical protein